MKSFYRRSLKPFTLILAMAFLSAIVLIFGVIKAEATSVAVPASLTVPASDANGVYTVSWVASVTAGVIYVLEEATNPLFTTGRRVAYSGAALSFGVAGRNQNKTYYYRVRAQKSGLTNSAWRLGENGCAIPGTSVAGRPALITVPTSDADGTYPVTWGVSATAGVTYILEEATDSAFTIGRRTAYAGTARTVTISGRALHKTYYYRVKATKAGFRDSAWQSGGNGCAVPGTVAAGLTSITVPATDADGAFTVRWGASATPGVRYVLEEATNAAFTAGQRTVGTVSGLSKAIVDRGQGVTYYYRAKAIKAGYRDSIWKKGANGCAVGSGTGTYTAPADPIAVTSHDDPAHAVTAVIPVGGGKMTATGADGSVFTLTIPSDVLLFDTEITMTPVVAIDDLPLSGGLGAAVKLEPEGLRFNNFATLTIVPAVPIPLAWQTFYSFQREGDDFHLLPPVMDSSIIEINLLHFTGVGVGSGSTADRTAILLHKATSAENRLNQNMSERIRLSRENGGTMEDLTAGLLSELQAYDDQVVTPRIQAASSSCKAGDLAMQTLLGLERQRQLLGSTTDHEEFLDRVRELMPQVAQTCIEEAYQDCVIEHDLFGVARVVLGYWRQWSLLGSDEMAPPWGPAGMEKIKQCLHFELQFNSTNGLTFMASEGSVSGVIPLQADLSNFPNEPITIKSVPPSPLDVDNLEVGELIDCSQISATEIHNLGDFEVSDLRFVFGGSDNMKIVNVEMEYYTPSIYGTELHRCKGTENKYYTTESAYAWHGCYLTLHKFESALVSESWLPLVARSWAFSGTDLLAQKNYNLSDDLCWGQTAMKLWHKPE